MTRDLNYQTPSIPPTNGLAIAGFVVSIVGLVTCALLSPVGLILSAFGLRREPRGLAVAGVVIGGLGTLAFVGFIGVMVFSVFAASRAVRVPAIVAPAPATVATDLSMTTAEEAIQDRFKRAGLLPADNDGNAAIAAFQDGWGGSLRYTRMSPIEFELRSAGPDGVFDNLDDIVRPSFVPAPAATLPAAPVLPE